ncbi:alkyldihydroxyacetonephosphate synthase-like [Malaya genurostris]|uniref:alkyldihydroxyacetonephosphate synthase-like n=1 Tax=Malaya genurostris TaxID=325434 RepID=UPI0026F3A7CA|nr:alkyldihydroxyacetonephosphate synthase-like [Malaya genurostris]
MGDRNGEHTFPKQIKSALPKHRHRVFRWDGWGYKDTRFLRDEHGLYCSGSRYFEAGENHVGSFWSWYKSYYDLEERPVEIVKEPTEFPEPLRNEAFLTKLKAVGVDYSEKGLHRFMRCHGQSLEDINDTRNLRFNRIPDLVIWPNCHEQVVQIVELAVQHDIALIPVGGNTSVSGATRTPEIMDRTIAVIDTTQMNRLLWLSKENLTACFESGAIGQDIERVLQKQCLTLGHEPDSYEFSTLGGWISTRASGVKKNVYGNIEDLVVRIKVVTPGGVLEKQFMAARVSCGPDIDHIIFGSEGTLGVITEAVVKVRPLPEVSKFESLVFRNFRTGVQFVREVAKNRSTPASVRLMDNTQLKIGRELTASKWHSRISRKLEDFYIEKYFGYSCDDIVTCVVMFEGTRNTVTCQQKEIYAIASKYGAIVGGAKRSEKSYRMIFIAAYIRDLAFEHSIYADSFETSVSWNNTIQLCQNVENIIITECKQRFLCPLLSYRLTQSYDTGCCIYFYLSVKILGSPEHSARTFMELESIAREAILANGGTVSHHHGIGKIRSKWYPATVSEAGVGLLKAIKTELDPRNIFAVGNLFPE